jgi:hypothetical protein
MLNVVMISVMAPLKGNYIIILQLIWGFIQNKLFHHFIIMMKEGVRYLKKLTLRVLFSLVIMHPMTFLLNLAWGVRHLLEISGLSFQL